MGSRMHRRNFALEDSRSAQKPGATTEARSQAASTQLTPASSGEYAESVAEDWTPENDDSPSDIPDRSGNITANR